MNSIIRIFCIFFIGLIILGYSCNKQAYGPIFLGTVIGFDQCTAEISDSVSSGYVIKIQKVTDTGMVVIETAMTYNLPHRLFTFHPMLFYYYKFTYLFPPQYRDSFKFKFSYIPTPKNQLVYSLCRGDIFLGPVYNATQNKEITITKIYSVVP